MLKKIYWQFLDEIEGVDEYIKCSTTYKDRDSEMSKMYYEMAVNELTHATKLYTAAKKIVGDAQSDLFDIMAEQLLKTKAVIAAAE